MPVELPASLLGPAEVEWRQLDNVISLLSPYDGARQDVRRPGERWACTITWPLMRAEEWRPIVAWLTALAGPSGRALIPYHGPALAGGASGSPTATGVRHAGTVSLASVGGTAPHFRAGDVIEIGERLYMVTADATASGGAVTLQIWPRLRADLSAAPVRLVGPRCTMCLADPETIARRGRTGHLAELDPVEFVEALP